MTDSSDRDKPRAADHPCPRCGGGVKYNRSLEWCDDCLWHNSEAER